MSEDQTLESIGDPSATGPEQPRSQLAPILICTNAMLAIAVGVALYQFGSVKDALAYVNGQRLFAEETAKSLPDVEAGKTYEVLFVLKNVGDSDLTIVGAKTSCSCVATRGLPMKLMAHSSSNFKVRFHAPPTSGRFRESITLYTDGVGHKELKLRIDGTTHASVARMPTEPSPVPEPTNPLIRAVPSQEGGLAGGLNLAGI